MKRMLVSLLLFVCLMVGWGIYLEIDKRNFIQSLSQQLELAGISTSSTAPSAVEMIPPTKTDRGQTKARVDNKHEGTSQEVAAQNASVDEIVDSDQWFDDVNLDLAGEPVPDASRRSDAFDVGLTTDSAQIEPDDPFGEALRKELVERFGNIPQVHTYIDFGRRWRDGTLTPDEDIERLEAQMYLFPNESTRKTLFFQRWLKANGGVMPQPTEETLAYLKAQGIQVTKTVTGTEVRVNISTK